MAPTEPAPAVNQEELKQLQSERDNLSETLTTTKQNLSLLEQEKQRIQKV